MIAELVKELAIVLIRISAYVRRQRLAEKIESLAIQLVGDVNRSDFKGSLDTVKEIAAFVSLGTKICEIEPTNSAIIIKELKDIEGQIRLIAGLPELRQIGKDLERREAKTVQTKEEEAPKSDIKSEYNGINDNSAIRQSKIVEKIRQSGNNLRIGIKDITGLFSGVSERTVRYDLERLLAKGAIERMGGGGPGTYYVIK